MSHCRKNSARDKVIGKKWATSEGECGLGRNTLHRCVLLQKVRAALKCGVVSFCKKKKITYF